MELLEQWTMLNLSLLADFVAHIRDLQNIVKIQSFINLVLSYW
jgi:hypothetical protein